MENMGKKKKKKIYQKLCHNLSPFPQGREGSLTANNPNLSATNVIQLNGTHSF